MKFAFPYILQDIAHHKILHANLNKISNKGIYISPTKAQVGNCFAERLSIETVSTSAAELFPIHCAFRTG
jgi:hypothetical protein